MTTVGPDTGPTTEELALYIVGGVLGLLVIAFLVLAVCFCRWKSSIQKKEHPVGVPISTIPPPRPSNGHMNRGYYGDDSYGPEPYGADPYESRPYGDDPIDRAADFEQYQTAAAHDPRWGGGHDFRSLPPGDTNMLHATRPPVDPRDIHEPRLCNGGMGMSRGNEMLNPRDESELVRQGVLLPRTGTVAPLEARYKAGYQPHSGPPGRSNVIHHNPPSPQRLTAPISRHPMANSTQESNGHVPPWMYHDLAHSATSQESVMPSWMDHRLAKFDENMGF